MKPKTRGGGIVIRDTSSKPTRTRPTMSARKNKAEEVESQNILRKKKGKEIVEHDGSEDDVDDGSDDDGNEFVVSRSQRTQPSRKRKGMEIEDDVAEAEVEEDDDEHNQTSEDDDEEEENVDIGLPDDPSLLKDYKDHVASEIWVGKERGIPTFRHHHGRYASATGWVLSKEPEKVQQMVKDSGLENLIKYPKQYLDKPLLAAFIERWYPETNTFHLPFGEMTITLDDVSRILGIAVVGKTFKGSYKSRVRCIKWLEEGLGIKNCYIVEELEKNKCLSVDLNWILAKTIKVKERSCDTHMMMRARGYLFYLLGSTLLSDKTGTRISVLYLECLMDFDVIPTYNWGSAALAFLYRQLGACSRASVKQMAGFLPLLETWILDHFPMRGIPNLDFVVGEEPTINRWHSHTCAAMFGNWELVGVRDLLDRLGPNSVTWHCLPDSYQVQPSTWYSGCLVCFDMVEAYHPGRVLRQMGRSQGIPKDPIPTLKTKRAKNGRGYNVEYPALQRYGDDWESHILSLPQQGTPASYPYQCTDDYVEWFYYVSHPIVTNPIHRKTGPFFNSTEHFNAQQKRIKRAIELGELGGSTEAILASLQKERRSKSANDKE